MASASGLCQAGLECGVVRVKAEADDVHGLPDKGNRDLDSGEVVQAQVLCGCSCALLPADFVVIGQGPQLNALGLGPCGQGFRGQGAV